ncbi:hypothetical protein PGTUg99_037642 [Puccinia graminis f. sp. tritici]|uniref:Uncharacterized protein n=1 Tax=Puccinia graminis f. sp. tritici TaxID=56615 RepID=A0A5B0SRD6_PUCGR|nr:hypothetical protein PGTUg99_037642 [Puccinia graminis f. sp. tritici]
MGYSPPTLHYGQLPVAAARSVTQTFQVKLNPHATSAAATTQTEKRQITLHYPYSTPLQHVTLIPVFCHNNENHM